MRSAVLDRRLALLGLTATGLTATGLTATGLAACGGGGAGSAGALPSDMSLGKADAPNTLVEYASVGCPVCGKWAREIFPQIKAKWIDTGKLRFTYREMLVGQGVELQAAAAGFVLARCSGADKYFPVVDAIYAGQEQLFQAPRPTLLNIARSTGMTEEKFNACMGEDAAFAALNKRVEANSAKDSVNATPTFIVNGKKLEAGFHTLAEIEALLKA